MFGHRRFRLGAFLGLALGATTALFACAPFLSNWLLGADVRVLEGPSSRFADEVARLLPPENAPADGKSGAEVPADTAAAEEADLKIALADTAPAERERLLAGVRELRGKL